MNIDPSDLKIESHKHGELKVVRSEERIGGQTCGMPHPLAVTITHIPTGLMASCWSERSQLKNKNVALNMIEYGLSELGFIYPDKPESSKFQQGVYFTCSKHSWSKSGIPCELCEAESKQKQS